MLTFFVRFTIISFRGPKRPHQALGGLRGPPGLFETILSYHQKNHRLFFHQAYISSIIGSSAEILNRSAYYAITGTEGYLIVTALFTSMEHLVISVFVGF